MSDLIDRQAALQAMDTWDKFGCGPDGKLVRCGDDNHYVPYVHYDDMVHAIKHLPSAQPERKTGTWEELTVDDNQVEEWQSARCSVCKHYQTMPYLYYFKKDKYCPNCGAKMREDNDKTD